MWTKKAISEEVRVWITHGAGANRQYGFHRTEGGKEDAHSQVTKESC